MSLFDTACFHVWPCFVFRVLSNFQTSILIEQRCMLLSLLLSTFALVCDQTYWTPPKQGNPRLLFFSPWKLVSSEAYIFIAKNRTRSGKHLVYLIFIFLVFFFAREIKVVSICQAEDGLGWGAQGDHCEPHSRGAAGGERAGGHTSTTAGRAVGARNPADPCGKGCVMREGCTANPCTTRTAATWEPARSPLLPPLSQDLPFDFNTPARS